MCVLVERGDLGHAFALHCLLPSIAVCIIALCFVAICVVAVYAMVVPIITICVIGASMVVVHVVVEESDRIVDAPKRITATK